MIPLIYSWGPKAMDTVPDTGQGSCPLFFSKLPDRCISSSLEKTVLAEDLMVFKEAGVLSAGSVREGLLVVAGVLAALFLAASLMARSRARLMAAAIAPDSL